MTAASGQSLLLRLATGLVAAGCVALQLGRRLDLAALSAAIWIITVALADRKSLRRLLMPKFWTITIVFALGSGLLLGPRDLDILGLRLSAQGLEAGALMICRGVFIFALVSWVSRAIDGGAVAGVARRVGLGELGLAVASAFGVLPALRDGLRERREAIGSIRRRGAAKRLVVEVLVETAHLAERLSIERGERARLVVVTGGRGAGKTTALGDLAEALSAEGLTVGGVLQPALEEEGERRGYELVDVASGERRAFAKRRASGRGFDFDEAGWAWSAARLERAQRGADVVLVDELGLLEARGEGHLPALRRLAERPGRAALLFAAVREGCLEAISEALGEPAMVFEAPLDAGALEQLRALGRALPKRGEARAAELGEV